MSLVPYLLGVLGVAATALASWRIAKRQTSGSAGATAAATLWAENTKIRQEAVARADKLQTDLDALRVRVYALEAALVVEKMKVAGDGG